MNITLKNGVQVPVLTQRSVTDIVNCRSARRNVTAFERVVSREYDAHGRVVIRGPQENCPECDIELVGFFSYMCSSCWTTTRGLGRYILTPSRDPSVNIETNDTFRVH